MARIQAWYAAALTAVIATQAAGQTTGVPAEFPPDSYGGNQYVDSDGCAFVRAGISGVTSWVPRVDRQRRQLCNFQPTFAAPAPTAPASDAPQPAPAVAAPTITIAAAPAAAPVVRPVIAPVIAAPVVAAPVATPQAIASPAPVSAPTAAVAPAAPSAPSAATPQKITFAEACAGKSGIQLGFISAATGNPIDCGPAPQVAQTAAPAPTARRMTLAAACAEIARTGQVMINAATNAPLVCPQAPTTVAAATPATCDIPASANHDVRCGPQLERPYTMAATTTSRPVTRSLTASFSALGSTAIPASNPAPRAHEVIRPPAGYQTVWNDGRLNPNRGLPKPAVAARVSTRSTAAVAATGHRYVQVGSFGDHDNAAALGQRLQAQGLPVQFARRGALRVVLAGPFASAQALQNGLTTVHEMGFSDAFPRR